MEQKAIKYPQVKVKLVGQDGNAFSVIGRTITAMREAGLSTEQRDEFYHEATAGDYAHLLQTVMSYVTTDSDEEDEGDEDEGAIYLTAEEDE